MDPRTSNYYTVGVSFNKRNNDKKIKIVKSNRGVK